MTPRSRICVVCKTDNEELTPCQPERAGETMSLGLVAALTGLCFAGALAAITIGLKH